MAVSSSVFSQLANVKNVVKCSGVASSLSTRITNRMNNVCLYSTATAAVESKEKPDEPAAPRKMSKAMLAYLERARAHDSFIKQERADYEIGKRHLANMMGEDPEHFTQVDIDNAIEYLLPSGLYDKNARPVMQPPEKMFPPRKAAEFDETGRPFHFLFYTTTPNYYQALYDIVEQLQAVNKLEDEMISRGVAPDPNIQFDVASSDWVNLRDLEKILLEEVTEKDYEYFISSIERLVNHPYSYQAKDLLMKFRKPRRVLAQSFTIPEVEYDANGRPFVTVPGCMRKSAFGSVTLKGKGSGKITINGTPLADYFPHKQNIEQTCPEKLIFFEFAKCIKE